MKKQRSMNLFLLLQAVFFAASVYADSDNHDILVVEDEGDFHTVSLARESNGYPRIYSDQLIWGNPLSIPTFVESSERGTLRTLLSADDSFVKVTEHGLVSNAKDPKTSFEFNSEMILTNPVLFSCPRGSFNTLHTKESIQANSLHECKEAKVRKVPCDINTRSITLTSDGGVTKSVFLNSEPEKAPLVLFFNVDEEWQPLSLDYRDLKKDQINFVFNEPVHFPLEVRFQNGQLVSTVRQIPGFVCLEDSKLFLNSKECSKETSFLSNYDNNELMVDYLCSAAYNCIGSNIKLFYYDRINNLPIVNKQVEIPSFEKPAVTPESEPDNDDNDKKPHLVFAVKKGDSFTPLGFSQMKKFQSFFGYNEVKNPPRFVFSDGIAATEDTETPGSVQISAKFLTFGEGESSKFKIDEDGKVNHEFYKCQVRGFTNHFLATTYLENNSHSCTPETVYLLHYDKVIGSVENGSQNQGSNGNTVTQNPDGKQDPRVTNPSGDDTNSTNDKNSGSGSERKGESENSGSDSERKGESENSGSGSETKGDSGSENSGSSSERKGESENSGSDSGRKGESENSGSGSKTKGESGSENSGSDSGRKGESENSGSGSERKGESENSGESEKKKKEKSPDVKTDTEHQSGDEKGSSVNTNTDKEETDNDMNASKSTKKKPQNPVQSAEKDKSVNQPQAAGSESVVKSKVGFEANEKSESGSSAGSTGDSKPKPEISVLGTSESKTITDAKAITEESSSDTVNDTLNNKAVYNLNGNSTNPSKANATTTICIECEHGSQTTVWKTYTDYTTYCPQETTVTITVCEEVCVPSTITVAAASTLTVTGKLIVPETTTVVTGKEHSEAEGRLNGGGKSEQKVNVEDSPSKEDGQKAHDQKDSVGQKEGFKPSEVQAPKSSQPKALKQSQPKSSKVEAENNAKGEDKSGNSGNRNSGNGAKASNGGKASTTNAGLKSIAKPAIEPFVNAASKNALGACVMGFAALLF